MKTYAISFVDKARPPGKRFMGGCYVLGKDHDDALNKAMFLGISPGGEAAITGPLEDWQVRPAFRNYLLSWQGMEQALRRH